MGLAILVVGLVVFLGAHVFVTCRSQRAAVIARIGEGPYKGLFSLVSLVGLILIGYGFAVYRATGWIDVWYPPRWTHYVTQLLMWPASIFVVAAYIRGDIWRTLKHPMLVGVKTWAVAHLISNGDLGSIVLFGALLAWAVYRPHHAQAPHRSGRAADPGRRPPARLVAIAVGTRFTSRSASFSIRCVIGVPVFGKPPFRIAYDVRARRDQAADRARHPRPQGRRADRVVSPPITPIRRAWSIATAT